MPSSNARRDASRNAVTTRSNARPHPTLPGASGGSTAPILIERHRLVLVRADGVGPAADGDALLRHASSPARCGGTWPLVYRTRGRAARGRLLGGAALGEPGGLRRRQRRIERGVVVELGFV